MERLKQILDEIRKVARHLPDECVGEFSELIKLVEEAKNLIDMELTLRGAQ